MIEAATTLTRAGVFLASDNLRNGTLIFLSLLGLWLPTDWLYAWSGIVMYADIRQQAKVFLWLLALYIAAGGAFLTLAAIATFAARFKLIGKTSRECFARVCLWLVYMLVLVCVCHQLHYWLSSVWGNLREIGQFLFAIFSILVIWLPYKWCQRDSLHKPLHSLLKVGSLATAIGALVSVGVLIGIPGTIDAKPNANLVKVSGVPPPIVLITFDTLSALHLSMYGYGRETSPRLREFAEHAMVFKRNYANSNMTTSTVASFLSGYRPWRNRAVQLEGKPLPIFSAESLPSLLQSAGYFTASISTNEWASPRHLGLEDYFDFKSIGNVCKGLTAGMPNGDSLAIAIRTSWLVSQIRIEVKEKLLKTCPNGTHFDPAIAVKSALKVIDSWDRKRPLFLWIHFLPPHSPYVSPEPFIGSFDPSPFNRDGPSTNPPEGFHAGSADNFPGIFQSRYDESIKYVDYHLGRFLDELGQRGLFDSALIMISADHGESFSKGYGGHGGPLLHEELVRVPLIIKAARQTQGQIVEELSEQVDYVPTLLDFAGINYLHGGEGVSLLPAIDGAHIDRPIFTMNFQQSTARGRLNSGSVAMIDGHWKYVYYFGEIHYPEQPKLIDALYDLNNDPVESRDLIAHKPDIAGRMLKAVQSRLAQFDGPAE